MTAEINDPAGLAALAPLWRTLLAQTPGASFFHSLDWLATYWKHFGGGQRLRVLVVDDGGAVGILPLVVRRVRRRLGIVRVLTYPLDDWGSFYGPLGGDPVGTLAGGLSHVLRAPRDWHVIELPWVDALASDGGATRAAFDRIGLETCRERRQTSAIINLAQLGSWDSYWGTRQSRWRNNVRRSEKKLACRGKVTYVRHRPGASGDPRWDWYDACETIARASWQAGSQSGTTLVHDSVRAFLRDCHGTAAAAGALDLNLLLLDDRPVAFNYAYHYGGHVYGLRTGYDARAAAEGAGSVLQARMIADSFARGDHTYDLGPDYLECKRYWLTETRGGFRYTYFPPGVGMAQWMRAGRALRDWWQGGVAEAPAQSSTCV
jgi:CelD/BcsL family acetyltransferase involved in cellulose biosynthesis